MEGRKGGREGKGLSACGCRAPAPAPGPGPSSSRSQSGTRQARGLGWPGPSHSICRQQGASEEWSRLCVRARAKRRIKRPGLIGGVGLIGGALQALRAIELQFDGNRITMRSKLIMLNQGFFTLTYVSLSLILPISTYDFGQDHLLFRAFVLVVPGCCN